MNRFIQVSVLAVVAALGFTSAGCRKGSKHPTPIPGYYATGSTNYEGGGLARSGIVRNDRSNTSTAGNLGGDNGASARNLSGINNNGPDNGGPGLSNPSNNIPLDPTALNPLGGDPGDFDSYTKDATMFQGNTAYFEYDRAAIKKSEVAKVAAVAEHMKSNPSHALMIEGHCDERGTDGYNLALGERRALAAREVLINLGVNADRIRTISYGENKPAVDGHTEAAWSKNRRAQFILMTPPRLQ